MGDYRQPEFYRFNRDSLDLAKFVEGRLGPVEGILDLGAGCGVIGLELARTMLPRRLALIELQADFEPYLNLNISTFAPAGVSVDVTICSFADWRSPERWDLVVTNPPYYLPGRGEVGKDLRRHRARTFIEGGWPTLAAALNRALAPSGRGFIVLKNDPHLLNTARSELSREELKVEVFEFQELRFLEVTR